MMNMKMVQNVHVIMSALYSLIQITIQNRISISHLILLYNSHLQVPTTKNRDEADALL